MFQGSYGRNGGSAAPRVPTFWWVSARGTSWSVCECGGAALPQVPLARGRERRRRARAQVRPARPPRLKVEIERTRDVVLVPGVRHGDGYFVGRERTATPLLVKLSPTRGHNFSLPKGPVRLAPVATSRSTAQGPTISDSRRAASQLSGQHGAVVEWSLTNANALTTLRSGMSQIW